MSRALPVLNNANRGWLYYKRYYQNVDFSKPDKDPDNEREMVNINDTITSFTYPQQITHAFNRVNTHPGHACYLVTTYPGLLTGSGYTHETNRLGETKIGFFFDHVTGLPCLPGHSVKGKLRASFPQWHNKKIKYQLQKQEYLLSILRSECQVDTQKQFHDYLNGCSVNILPDYSDTLFMTMLEKIIFEGLQPDVSKTGEWTIKNGEFRYKNLSIYKRDIFHDAYISHGGKENKIFGMDAITPHEHPLRNPVPLAFIKVLPNVYWTFQFHLKDNFIDAASKQKLFFFLLAEWGIGAKTNVGYGQFKSAGYLDVDEWKQRGMPTPWPVQVPSVATMRNRNSG